MYLIRVRIKWCGFIIRLVYSITTSARFYIIVRCNVRTDSLAEIKSTSNDTQESGDWMIAVENRIE